MGLRLKTRVDLYATSEKRIVRFPDPHSANVKEEVKSIVVGVGLKCGMLSWYAMTNNDLMCHVAATIQEFKRYPKSGWRGPLFKAAERSVCLSGAQVARVLRGHTHPR